MQQDQDFSRITMQQQDFSSMPTSSNIGIGGYQPNGMEMFNSFPKPLGGPMDGYRGPTVSGIMAALPSSGLYAEPLQQYGQYLEQQYGKPDFPQKREQFLQEVSQKEQQTFQNNMNASSMLGQPIGSYDLMNRPLGQPFNSFSGQQEGSYFTQGPYSFGTQPQSAGQTYPTMSESMQNYGRDPRMR